MIVDESGRFVLTQANDATLWRYDRRWRKVDTFEPVDGAGFTTLEGEHHIAVVSQPEPEAEIEITVRSAKAPAVVLATGRYVDTWVFEGDSSVWAAVPEWIITRKQDGSKGLLRVADDAEVDPLEEFDPAVLSVAPVPNSRLVVIATPGAYTVYDPFAPRAIRHFKLAGGNPTPTVRFRNDDELWINDVDIMLKIETRQFEEVIDAAGSEVDSDEMHGGFGKWTFAAGNELCVVTRPDVGDVLVLDVVSMLPVARGVFAAGAVPLEAVLVGRNAIVAIDAEGRPLRSRLKRVAINFENAPADDASSADDAEDRSPG